MNKNDDVLSKIYYEYCSNIVKIEALDEKHTNYIETLLDSLELLSKKSELYVHVPYAQITSSVYMLNIDKGYDYNKVYNNIEEKFGYINTNTKFKEKFKKDTLRDVHLALIQRKYINGSLEKANKLADNTSKKLKDIKSDKSNIYTDFISILSIFTAITFATFGGLQLLGNVFGNIKEMNVNNVGNIIVLGSIYIFGIYLILMILFKGVSKFTMNKYYFSIPFNICIWTGIFVLFCIGIFYNNKILIFIILASLLILFIIGYILYLKINNKNKE